MAQQSFTAGRPGNPGLADYRGPEPAPSKPGEAPDPAISPPVDDDSAATGVRAEDGGDAPRRAPSEPAHPTEEDTPVIRKPPGDERRMRMMERLDGRRREDGAADDGAAADGAAADGEGAARAADTAAAGDDASGDADGEGDGGLMLAVNGRTLKKSAAEVAALSGLSEQEVAERPEMAKRFAQMALAAQENLDQSRIGRREIPSPGPAGTRPAAASEEDGETGRGVVEPKPSASRKTSAEDVTKLIEDIQLGDPAEVGPKVVEFMEQVARDAASGVVTQAEGQRRVEQELGSNVKAWVGFLEDHPELKGKRAVTAAISTKLDDEMKADLRTVLIRTEGMSEADADDALRLAEQERGIGFIRNAHVERRLQGNPHVRPVDKAMAEKVWDKVRQEFGLPETRPRDPSSSSSPQGARSRESEKRALPTQPRRASPAPAVSTAPASGTIPNRRAVAAEMATRTGRKARPVG